MQLITRFDSKPEDVPALDPAVFRPFCARFRKLVAFTSPHLVAPLAARMRSDGVEAIGFDSPMKLVTREARLAHFAALPRAVLVTTLAQATGWRVKADGMILLACTVPLDGGVLAQALGRADVRATYFVGCLYKSGQGVEARLYQYHIVADEDPEFREANARLAILARIRPALAA